MQVKAPVDIGVKDKEVRQLLKIQELFHNHYLTEELLNDMISLYVKFVENVHSNQHPLRLFFMEKIKFVLSRPQVLKILEKRTQAEKQNFRETMRGAGIDLQDQLQIKKIAEQAKEQVRKNHQINLKKERPHNADQTEQLRTKQRNMKIQMQLQIMESVERNMEEIHRDLYKAQKKQQLNSKEIRQIVTKQDDFLNQRRENRRKKLRKKSVQFKEKQVFVVQSAPPITTAELKEMKNQLNQTYERFTRLTMSKNRTGTNNSRENTGKVKKGARNVHVQEQLLDQIQEKQQKKPPIANFSKKKNKQAGPEKANKAETREETAVEIQTFQQPKGRVTNRRRDYEEIEDDSF